MKKSLLSGLVCLACTVPAALPLQGATVVWDGGGSANASGTWETGTNWSTDTIPGAADTAQLNDVTSGTRTVTISSGSPQTITKLTVTQSTVGASQVINLDDNLTITSGTPFAITATAGQSSIITNIGAGKTLRATNAAGAMASPTYNGILNLGAGSTFRLEALGAASDLTLINFGGPVNATGAGAAITFQAGRFVQTPTFSGAVNLSNSGTSLTISSLNGSGVVFGIGGTTNFSGNDGSGNAVNIAAGTIFNLNYSGSTTSFANRVSLAAASGPDVGGILTAGLLNASNGATTNNFNSGLVLGAGAAANFNGANVVTNLAGTSSLATGAVMKLASDNAQGSWNLANTGNFTMDGASVVFDWEAASSNNPSSTVIGRRFLNSGTWTLQNSSSISLISNTGRPVTGGFSGGINNENSGTFNVKTGSKVGFFSMFNTGTMNLGSSTAGVSDSTVYLGSPDNTFPNVTLTNGATSLNVDGAGTINILGNTVLGRTTYVDGTITLNNGDASSTGSVLNVGDGTTPTTLTISGRNAVVTNFAGNTANVKAGGTLFLSSLATGTVNTGNATFANNGTLNQSGTLKFQSNATAGVRNLVTASTGVHKISGTGAVIVSLPNNGGATPALAYTNSGVLTGSSSHDKLFYDNLQAATGQTSLTLQITGGEVTPGNGSNGSGTSSIGQLELENINVTFNSTSKLTLDIGGSVASGLYDSLTTSGEGAVFTLAGTLDIRSVNGYVGNGETYTFLSTAGFDGFVTGTFDTLLYNGASAAGLYTVDYSNFQAVQITFNAVPEPSTYALIGMGLGVLWMLRRRKMNSFRGI